MRAVYLIQKAGAEGDADIVDTARCVQVEVKLSGATTKPTDIDDASQNLGAPKRVIDRRSVMPSVYLTCPMRVSDTVTR